MVGKANSPGRLPARSAANLACDPFLKTATVFAHPGFGVPNKLVPDLILSNSSCSNPTSQMLPNLRSLEDIGRQPTANMARHRHNYLDVLPKSLNIPNPSLAGGVQSILCPVIRPIIVIRVLMLVGVNGFLLTEMCLDLNDTTKPTHVFFSEQTRILGPVPIVLG